MHKQEKFTAGKQTLTQPSQHWAIKRSFYRHFFAFLLQQMHFRAVQLWTLWLWHWSVGQKQEKNVRLKNAQIKMLKCCYIVIVYKVFIAGMAVRQIGGTFDCHIVRQTLVVASVGTASSFDKNNYLRIFHFQFIFIFYLFFSTFIPFYVFCPFWLLIITLVTQRSGCLAELWLSLRFERVWVE